MLHVSDVHSYTLTWLLVWKGICVIIMVVQFIAYVRLTRQRDLAKGNQAE